MIVATVAAARTPPAIQKPMEAVCAELWLEVASESAAQSAFDGFCVQKVVGCIARIASASEP